MATFPRYNARRGNIVNLKREFYQGGVLTNPNFIEKVEIHKVHFDDEDPTNTLITTIDNLNIVNTSVGKYEINYDIPADLAVNYIYLDVWYYRANADSDIQPDASSQFRVFENDWFTTDGSTNYKFQLYPDIKSFTKGEKKNIELQIVPLPLYNTEEALDQCILPITGVSVKVETKGGELIQDWTNTITQNLANKAYVNINTTLAEYRKGVYYYWVRLELPNSDIIISQKFAFNIV